MVSTVFERRIDQVRAIIENYGLFFVCGAPKSGTTWLQKSLDAHPQILCAGEGHFADMFVRKIFKPVEQYFIHQRVVTKNVYEGDGFYQHLPREDFAFVATAFILGAFSRLKISSETRLIGDKTPANVEHLELLHYLFPEAKIINIVRDGRDVLVSTLKHLERVSKIDGTRTDLEEYLSKKTRLYASRWVKAVENAEKFGAKYPGVMHTVRYEDLKQDFSSAFFGIVDFLGVEVSQEEVARCEAETSFKRLSGGRDPGDEDPSAFMRKGIVGDWRTSLTPQHLEIFNSVGANSLAHFGYDT